MTGTKLSVSQIVAAFEAHCDSQYFKWEVSSVSDIVEADGFTVATIVYIVRKDGTPTVCRWSYRWSDLDDRVTIYYHDQSDHKQAAQIPGS